MVWINLNVSFDQLWRTGKVSRPFVNFWSFIDHVTLQNYLKIGSSHWLWNPCKRTCAVLHWGGTFQCYWVHIQLCRSTLEKKSSDMWHSWWKEHPIAGLEFWNYFLQNSQWFQTCHLTRLICYCLLHLSLELNTPYSKYEAADEIVWILTKWWGKNRSDPFAKGWYQL